MQTVNPSPGGNVATTPVLAPASTAGSATVAPVTLPVLGPNGAASLAARTLVTTTMIQGTPVPATQNAMTAGIKALANQITLDYQAGTITQTQFNQAIAKLSLPAQPSPPSKTALNPADRDIGTPT